MFSAHGKENTTGIHYNDKLLDPLTPVEKVRITFFNKNQLFIFLTQVYL
jgi:hypothetical protein